MAAKMIDFACRTPEQIRAAIIGPGLGALGLQQGTPAILKSAGVNVGSEMMKIPFRQIPAPDVVYGNNNTVVKKAGQWNTIKQQFHSSATAINGNVIFLSPPSGGEFGIDPLSGKSYIAAFQHSYSLNGVKLKPNFKILDHFERIQDPLSADSIAKQISGAGLVVLVLLKDNSRNRVYYAAFRAAADQLTGTPSIVLCEQRMQGLIGKNPDANPFKKLVPYMANNAMKINVRLGNENHIVSGAFQSLKNTLVLGADLIHPKQDNLPDVPSIASLVGSINNRYATFYGSSRRTAHGEEIITQDAMQSMVVERIISWRNHNGGGLPANILYYRDGTGHTQYKRIRQHEVQAIRNAWNEIQLEKVTSLADKKIKLKITSVVVVKRHTTRFYPTDSKDPKLSLIENCLPGTVIETHITSPYYHFDFFLQSHTVEKDSAKPTHYFVLDNEMKFDQDSLQNVTNGFCYNFAHSTSPVSYASPAYLADQLCERASLYLHRWYTNDSSLDGISAYQRRQGMDHNWGRGNPAGKNPWSERFNSKMFWM